MQPSPSPCLPRNRGSAVGDQAQLRSLTHPGWNNDIPHHVIQPPRCLLAPSSRPLGSHIPGQRRSRPRHCPGGATLGLCWCQGKRIRSVPRGADVIHERCWRAQSLLCPSGSLTKRQGKGEEGRERRELHPNAEPDQGAQGGGSSPRPWQGFLQPSWCHGLIGSQVGLNDL